MSNKPSQFIGNDFVRRLFVTLVGVLLVYVIVLAGALIRNELKKYDAIGRAPKNERIIVVEGQGKVTATSDIAMTTMGMTAEGKTVAEAQEKNTKVMNALIAKLKELGVDTKDIQTTNYSVFPKYNYTDGRGQELVGYEVQQQVTVKIRDLSTSSDVLALAGEVGANSVSGLSFTIDDPEVYKAQARDEALGKVADKMRSLSNALGVRIVGIVSYNEYEGGVGGPVPYWMKSYEGMGGGVVTPTIEPGSNEVMMNVAVTFEIR